MTKSKRTYGLPSGKVTTSVARYIREWNGLAKPVARALGCEVIGLDPGIHLMPKGASVGFQISVSVAERIKDMIDTCQYYRRCVDDYCPR